MKLFKTAFAAVFCFFLLGLTPYEASLYGSRILVCGPEGKIVRYWTTTQFEEKGRKGKENFVFDLETRKPYPYARCEIYKCSPEPGRMKGCVLPEK